MRVDEVSAKADRVGGVGGKEEEGDDDGHPIILSSSFSSDADGPAFGEGPKADVPRQPVPGWDPVHDPLPDARAGGGRSFGAVVFQ